MLQALGEACPQAQSTVPALDPSKGSLWVALSQLHVCQPDIADMISLTYPLCRMQYWWGSRGAVGPPNGRQIRFIAHPSLGGLDM
jgi:hypothetical protein